MCWFQHAVKADIKWKAMLPTAGLTSIKYTACGPKICMGTMVYDVPNAQLRWATPSTLQTEHRTRLQAWFNTCDVSFPTSRQPRGVGGWGASHACAQTLFCLAWDTSIYKYIYTSISIHLYTYIVCE